jgi:hypothetical protein
MRVSAGSLYPRRRFPFRRIKRYLNGEPFRETAERTIEQADGKWKTLAMLPRYDMGSEVALALAAHKLDAVTADGRTIGHMQLVDGF